MKSSNEQNSKTTEGKMGRWYVMVAITEIYWNEEVKLKPGQKANCFISGDNYCLFKKNDFGHNYKVSALNEDVSFYIIEEEIDLTNYGVF